MSNTEDPQGGPGQYPVPSPGPVPAQWHQDPEAPQLHQSDPVDLARRILRRLHLQHAGGGIRLPDAAGRFSSAAIANVPPVVVDANVLRNDVIYSCRHDGTPTTLVNATNSGLIRTFCARHVISEVAEHYRGWAQDAALSPQTFARRFNELYAPQLRSVADIPADWLTPAESARIEKLRSQDSDDVPSVILGLGLEAVFLSTDGHATTAVYGAEVPPDELQQWRLILQAGGNAGMLGSMFEAPVLLVGATGQGVWNLFDRATGRFSPWARLLIAFAMAAGGGYALHRLPERHKSAISEVWQDITPMLDAVLGEYAVAIERLRKAGPPVPSWTELAAETDAESGLARACLHTLARSKRSDRSAVELSERLPSLPLPRGSAKVRAVLRHHGCFQEVYQGRFQVGRAIVSPNMSL